MKAAKKSLIAAGIACLAFLLSALSWSASLTPPPHETAPQPQFYFCPRDGCTKILLNELKNAKYSINCALYDLSSEEIIIALQEMKINKRVVVDDNNFQKASYLNFMKKDDSKQLMHNKFCVIDDKKVLTGSFNPTRKEINNDNLAIIESEYLSKNYLEEFEELWQGKFGEGRKTKYPLIYLNEAKFENFFCPEDDCEKQAVSVLKNAKSSIYFMTFAFTSNRIAETIISKKTLDVKGVFEKNQNSKWSQYEKLKAAGISVKLDSNKYNMHHKVFIIDSSIIIFGSYNPTESGNERNDENMLIIYDEMIAKKFLEEFNFVFYN
ncbi:hypothetical protein HY643_04915 [Candidatus Woesearchaeota archaeon]|nr:hypothetical protein [Candidatus Woesearchaeota archaeon]